MFVARFSLVHNVFDEKPEMRSAGWIGVQPHLVALLDFGAGAPLRDLDREQVENAVHVLGLCVDLGRELCQLIENPDQEVSSRDVTLMVLGVGDVEVGQRGDEVFARPSHAAGGDPVADIAGRVVDYPVRGRGGGDVPNPVPFPQGVAR